MLIATSSSTPSLAASSRVVVVRSKCGVDRGSEIFEEEEMEVYRALHAHSDAGRAAVSFVQ
jgi:hypothetical protein